jgi:DNA-binding FadR family transcriptional regulator
MISTLPTSLERPETIRDFIVNRMLNGVFKPGDKLPTERALAEQFNIGRNEVRSVFASLASEGRIMREVGRGTFVADFPDTTNLVISDGAWPASPAAVMDARIALEVAIVTLVVRNATQPDFDEMEHHLRQSERAETLCGFEAGDAALHKAIAAATHNPLIVAFYQFISASRQQGEWGKLKRRIMTPQRRSTYHRQHNQIVAALQARDEGRARDRMLQHLRDVRRHLLDV